MQKGWLAMGHLQRQGGNISRVRSSPKRNMVCSTLHIHQECVLWTLQIRFTALIWGKNWSRLCVFVVIQVSRLWAIQRELRQNINNLFCCNAFRWVGFKCPLKSLLSCWHRAEPLENLRSLRDPNCLIPFLPDGSEHKQPPLKRTVIEIQTEHVHLTTRNCIQVSLLKGLGLSWIRHFTELEHHLGGFMSKIHRGFIELDEDEAWPMFLLRFWWSASEWIWSTVKRHVSWQGGLPELRPNCSPPRT